MTVMNCEEVHGWLLGSTPADLEIGDAPDVRMHIDHCPSCAAAEKEIRSFDASLRDAVRSEAVDDRDVRHEILGRIRERRGRLPAAVLRVAAAALLAVTALLAWTSSREPAPLETLALRHHREEVLGRERLAWVSDQKAIIRLLAERVGAPSANVSQVVSGRVRAARLCQLDGKPQVHLLVDGPAGTVSLFICRDPATHRVVASSTTASGSLRSAAIASNHLAVIAVGPVSEREAMRLARETWSTLAI